MDKVVELFKSGVHNLLPSEKIPDDAAQDALNFFTKDGKVVLSYGRTPLGDIGSVGTTRGFHPGYKVDGTKVLYCKFGTTIKYWDGSAWQDVITGLTENAEYTFANYSSLAGSFTFVGGVDGLWKIVNANPTNAVDVYNSSKNFKGFILIDKGRTILWNREKDKTGIYGSRIDRQDGTVYTTVSGENIGTGDGVTKTFTETLDFKAGGSRRTCFGVTVTDGTETFTDDYLGNLTGSAGGTGTINYATGAISITFNTAPINLQAITSSYQWEDSSIKGVMDFSKSATRLAGEGFQFPQDEGGDPILNVLIGQDGAYYSLKKTSAYSLSIDADDLGADNLVYRKDMGLPNFRASVSTNRGIVFINTSNPTKPEMMILQRNRVSLDVEPVILFPHFDFTQFDYTDACLSTYDRWVLVFCKIPGADNNNRILLCDIARKTVDISGYTGKMSAQDGNTLYVADSITQTVYEVFSGFDDLGLTVDAFWKNKSHKFSNSLLAKIRRLRFKGHIDPDQVVGVWMEPDSSGFTKVGEIRGDASYVNYQDTQTIGSQMVGEDVIGGDSVSTNYGYYTQIKVRTGKFRTISIMLIPEGIGYFDFDLLTFWDILAFEDRIPKAFRN